MIIKKCDFITSAVEESQYPVLNLPEIAFSGRSNVGKSSLMNSLMNRRKLVKVSGNPGKTRTINFFNVNDEIVLVDLPGYGYAAVSKTEKEKWGKMIEKYLIARQELKEVVLLVDIRHKPTEDDKLMYDFIKYYKRQAIVVATKLDKLSKTAAQKNLEIISKELNLDSNDMFIPYSSETHEGREKLWELFIKYFSQNHER